MKKLLKNPQESENWQFYLHFTPVSLIKNHEISNLIPYQCHYPTQTPNSISILHITAQKTHQQEKKYKDLVNSAAIRWCYWFLKATLTALTTKLGDAPITVRKYNRSQTGANLVFPIPAKPGKVWWVDILYIVII